MAEAVLVHRPAGFPHYDQLGEGPFWDVEDQALYWVDIVGRRAMRFEPATDDFRCWDTPSVCSVVIPTTQGDLIVALRDGVHRMDPDSGAITRFAQPDLDPLNRSNDARTDAHGRLWLGTMGNNIGEDGLTIDLPAKAGGLYRVGADGHCHQALAGVGISNAIAFTPDGRRMTFSDTTKNVIWSFAVDHETGALSDRQVLFEGGPGHPDGAAMDEAGCLWNARWGASCIIRITPDGRIDRTLEVAAKQPSCCAFGGPERRTLYITSARQDIARPSDADGALLVAELDVAGVPMARFAG